MNVQYKIVSAQTRQTAWLPIFYFEFGHAAFIGSCAHTSLLSYPCAHTKKFSIYRNNKMKPPVYNGHFQTESPAVTVYGQQVYQRNTFTASLQLFASYMLSMQTGPFFMNICIPLQVPLYLLYNSLQTPKYILCCSFIIFLHEQASLSIMLYIFTASFIVFLYSNLSFYFCDLAA